MVGMGRRTAVAVAFAVGLAVAVGCARYPRATALAPGDPTDPYTLDALSLNPGNSDRTFVFVALSGGGTRAAAFSFGALETLSEARLADGNSVLLDEVDVISSVSGGSFAAAYYAAHGREAFLADFEQDVLHRKIESALIWRMLAPWNWFKLWSWWYGRSDLAAEYYGRMFDDKTFGELPRERPMIVLNATDISMGARFAFHHDHFYRLCADLNSVAVARGVTASSAFPVAFTPLSFRNYPVETCDYQRPAWIGNAERDLETNGSRFDRARTARSYEDPDRRVIHLSDGGLADNIGLRGPMEGLLNRSAPLSIIQRINRDQVDRIVFLVVDAKPRGEPSIDESSHPPGIFTVLNAAATTPMENYSTDTIELARSFAAQWAAGQAGAPGVGPQAAFYSIHVRFELEPVQEVREELQAIPTQLQLPEDQVELLVEKGGELMRRSIHYRCLMRKIGDAGAAPELTEAEQRRCPRE